MNPIRFDLALYPKKVNDPITPEFSYFIKDFDTYFIESINKNLTTEYVAGKKKGKV